MATVRLDCVSKHFGKVRAVDDVSLVIPDKRVVTLLGPSGCGKSTTLNLIAGLEDVTAGKIYLNDRDITDHPPHLRNMAMVFQNYALYPHMTVFENLAFALKLAKRPADERRRRVETVAELLGIGDLLQRRPSQLSGGQQQRVALGRAIVREPQVFLLDEPLSNLDARLRIHMRAELKRLQQQLETTTIFVTHDQEEAMILSDFIAVMQKGQVVQFGTPSEIYGRPAHLSVASFIGNPAMNLLTGTLTVSDGRPALVIENTVLRLPRSLAARLGNLRGEVTLGIRPEDVRLVDQPNEDTNVGVVSLLEPVGSATYVEVAFGRHHVTLSAHPDHIFQIGQAAAIEFDPAKIHLFDPRTGDRYELPGAMSLVSTDRRTDSLT